VRGAHLIIQQKAGIRVSGYIII